MAIFGICNTVCSIGQGMVRSGGHLRYGHTCKYLDKGRSGGCTQDMKTPAIFYLIIKSIIYGRFQISIILIVASEGGITQDDFDEH